MNTRGYAERIKKESDKNRYRSSQLSQRNYIHSLRCSELKFFSTRFGFSEMKRFEPRDVDTNEWTLFCQQQKYSGFSAQKHKREYKKQFTFKVTRAQICLRCTAPRAV